MESQKDHQPENATAPADESVPVVSEPSKEHAETSQPEPSKPVEASQGTMPEDSAPVPTEEPKDTQNDANGTQNDAEATEKPPEPPMPSDEAIAEKLREVLKEVDLATTTEKMLRRQLQSHFGVDLSTKKALIRSEIETYLQSEKQEEEAEEEEEEDEEEEDQDAKPTRKRKSNAAFGSILSEEMSAFLGMKKCPRTEVVKKMWEYIKANNLQDPKDRRRIILDDKMKTIFPGVSINMFSMQKHLSKHVFTSDVYGDGFDEESSDDEDDTNDDDEPQQPKQRSKPQPKSKKTSTTTSPADGKKKLTGFTKPLKLSPEMQAFMGSETAARPDITKRMWAYVKENNLQDPTNKQFILADETLKNLTGEARFQGFGFAKLIKQHILGYV